LIDISKLQIVLIDYLWFILGITIHEWGHAWVATRLGDDTPRLEGRLTLDPLVHISWVGTVLIPWLMILFTPGFAILGWGTPVNVNRNKLKYRKLGDILYSLAGPFMNFILGFLLLLLGFYVCRYGNFWASLCCTGASINISLGLFNLIPIPPLDGSHLLKVIIGMGEETFLVFSQFGTVLLLFLINFPIFKHYFSAIHYFVLGGFMQLGDMLCR
jgi:Zn-dependent protease